MYVSRTFTKAKKTRNMHRIPNELKIPFIQMEIMFSQFIDKLLWIEKMEYLIHYVKFKMWLALFSVNFLCFPNIFEFLC